MMMRREICLIAIILSLIELVELVSSRSKSEDNGDKDNYNGSTLINRLVKTVRDQSNRRRSADILLMTNDLVQSDEARQFCGETLYYVVEYYCVFVKGTSVYVPNENDDEQFDDENTNVGEKKNDSLKSKRKRQTHSGSSNSLYLSSTHCLSLSISLYLNLNNSC